MSAVRRPALTAALSLVALAHTACVAVVIEANDDASETATGSEGTSESDGDGDSGDGDGDGDGDSGDGDGDGDGDPESFRVVVIADPHVPSPSYAGGDDTIKTARERLLETRDKIAAIDPPPAFVIVLGDLVHEAYESKELVWYQTNNNAFAEIAEAFAGFGLPVYPLFGDSDYNVPITPKTFSHELFAQFFAVDPYRSFDHLGWRFVLTNSQYGQTFDEGTLLWDPKIGSFGSTQLGWLGDQLAGGMPTVVLSHFPLFAVADDEALNNGPYPDIEAVLAEQGDTVALVLSGHAHQWSNLPATYPAPHIVFGSTRFDSDNFLLIEFTSNALQYEILDIGKVNWGSSEAETWVYEGTPMPGG